MRRKHFLYPLLAISVLAGATPSSAATYYVAMNSKTKACSVTTRKPNGQTVTQVGNDTYKTKIDARTAMNAASDCSK